VGHPIHRWPLFQIQEKEKGKEKEKGGKKILNAWIQRE